jgi:hypothetical protein
MGPVKLPQAAAPELDFSIICASSSFIFRAEEEWHFSKLNCSITDFLKKGGGGWSRRAPSRGGAVGSRWPWPSLKERYEKREIFLTSCLIEQQLKLVDKLAFQQVSAVSNMA